MFMKSSEYLNLYFEDQKRKERLSKLNESAVNEELQSRMEESQNIYEQHLANGRKTARAAKIRQDVKKALLFECIYNVYKKSLGLINENYINESLTKSFVNDFIEENGVEKLLFSFKTKSYVLSEFSRIVNKYTDIICEKSNCENPENFSIDPEDKSNFYDELDMEDIDDASQVIRTRVSSAIDNFLSDNLTNKEEIKDIIQQSQDKISGTKNEELKEFYEIQAKKKITNVRERKPKSIFESMVFNVAKCSVLNEDMKKIYLKNNKLDMDKIVETCGMMYAFLETVNTCNMIAIDETYIRTVLDGIK